jgi:hypothetical protein
MMMSFGFGGVSSQLHVVITTPCPCIYMHELTRSDSFKTSAMAVLCQSISRFFISFPQRKGFVGQAYGACIALFKQD